jgi:hypothetical protein
MQGKAATPKQREAFLRMLRNATSVSDAAAAIGVARRSVYRWRVDDEAFRSDWDDATETITENIESALAKAALGGDTVSMIFWLKSHRPDVYNRKQVVAIGGDENAPPVAVVNGQLQSAGPVFILPDNRRDDIPSHMRPPPGFTLPPRTIEAEALPVADESKPEQVAVETTEPEPEQCQVLTINRAG